MAESWLPGLKLANKGLPIADRFIVGASVFRERNLLGFGLWIKREPEWYEVWSEGGFSWEWFDRENGAFFRKRQGPGRVGVTIDSGPDYEELTSVEFLDEITLRLNDSPPFMFSSAKTHVMVIGKGSVLRLAP